MEYTTNFNLAKPELNNIDTVGPSIVLNASNLDAIDTELKHLEDNKLETSAAYVHPNHTGDVTSLGDGAQTITNKAVTLAKMADMATASLIGRKTAAAGVPEVISKTDAKTLLDIDDLETDNTANKINIATVGKSLNDLADTLSQVNINQEAKQTASDIGTVSLPKNAANGSMGYKVNGLTATNLVINGNFANGTTGWNTTGCTISVSGGALIVTCSGTSATPSVSSSLTNYFSVNDKVYIRAKLRVRDSVCQKLAVRSAAGYVEINILTPTQDQWYEVSKIGTVAVAGEYLSASVRAEYADIETATGKVVEIQYVIASILTATFGSGNEPDLATCDKLFANWFDGTKSMTTARRIRSVGKNLFDGVLESGGIHVNGTKVIDATKIRSKNYIPVAPSTQYILKNHTSNIEMVVHEYDNSFAHLKYTWGTPNVFTTTANTKYILFRCTSTNLNSNLQLELGSTATAYEPYKESSLYISDAGVLRSVPNGVADTVENGVKTQNVQRYVLQASDIANYNLGETGSQVSYVTINRSTLVGVKSFVNNTISDFLITGKYNFFNKRTTAAVSYNLAENAFNTYMTDGELLYLVVTKGAYADLAAAQADLAGTVIYYQLAEPIESPVQTSGTLLSNPSGTVYCEKAIADAGIYSDKMTVLNVSFPIATLEKIAKIDFDTGVETEIDVSTAVIAVGGLSFTHPNLTADDIVFFTYLCANESTEGEMTLSYYDSRYTIKDTANEKFYQWKISSTNGVASIALTEV